MKSKILTVFLFLLLMGVSACASQKAQTVPDSSVSAVNAGSNKNIAIVVIFSPVDDTKTLAEQVNYVLNPEQKYAAVTGTGKSHDGKKIDAVTFDAAYQSAAVAVQAAARIKAAEDQAADLKRQNAIDKASSRMYASWSDTSARNAVPMHLGSTSQAFDALPAAALENQSVWQDNIESAFGTLDDTSSRKSKTAGKKNKESKKTIPEPVYSPPFYSDRPMDTSNALPF